MSALDIFRSTLTGGNRAKGVGASKAVYEAGDPAGSNKAYLRRSMMWRGREGGDIAKIYTTTNDRDDQFGGLNYYTQQRHFSNDVYTTVVGNNKLIDLLLPKGFSKTMAQIRDGKFKDPYGNNDKNGANAQEVVFWNSGTGFYATLYAGHDNYNKTDTPSSSSRLYQMPVNTATGAANHAAWFNVVVERKEKTEGLLQQYGKEGMRAAAMGYLTDGVRPVIPGITNAQTGTVKFDGGVLRAKMKDTLTEINSDGSFKINPESAEEGNSGVINYVNKFGDSAPYDRYDAVNELYYTAVRYLRNGAWQWNSDGSQEKAAGNANPFIYSNLTPKEKDNFPAFMSWDDPLIPSGSSVEDAQCYAPSIVILGDTNTHYDNRLPNFPTQYAPDEIKGDNVALEKDGTTTYEKVARLQGFDRWKDLNGGSKARDLYTDYSPLFGLAGMAHWVKTNEVRPDVYKKTGKPMHIQSFFIDVLENSFTKNFDHSDKNIFTPNQKAYEDTDVWNSFYLGAKFSAFVHEEGKIYTRSDFDSSNATTSSLWKSSSKQNEYFPLGIPKNFAIAVDPRNLKTALEDAFSSVNQAFSYTSQSHDTFNVRSPVTSENILDFTTDCKVTKLYTGPSPIQGVDVSSGYICSDEEHLLWNSKFNLSGNYGTVTGKLVDLVRKQDGSLDVNTLQKQLAFTGDDTEVNDYPLLEQQEWTTDSWDKNVLISSRKKTLFTSNGAFTANDVNGDQELYNYILGNDSKEVKNGGSFRNREKPLGTIVNSSVTGVFHLVTDHLQPYHYSKKFRADSCKFNESALTRSNYYGVAANDGIYHILDGKSGNEIYGFIPQPALAKISDIAKDDGKFHYSNDGFSIYLDYCAGSSAKSTLIGSTGRGGNSVYAIDMTTPDKPKFNWEFPYSTGSQYQDYIGYTISSPVKALFDIKDKPEQKIVVSSGYSNQSGTGSIFILDVDTGAASHIPLSANSVTAPAGVGEPFVYDENNDGVADVIYVGDFAGNLWKIDLIDRNTNQPKSQDWVAELLFQAADGAQPITGAPYADKVNGQTVVVFGTGHYFTADGVKSDVQNYAYGVYDDLDDNGKTITITDADIISHQLNEPPAEINESGRLLHTLQNAVCVNGTCGQSLDSVGTVDSKTGRITSLNNEYKGWRLELDLGRTIAANAQILEGNHGKYAYFVGVKNDSVNISAESNCRVAYGTTGVIALNLLTGGMMEKVFDTNMDTTIDENDENGAIMDIPNALSPTASGVVLILPEIGNNGQIIGQRTVFGTGIRDSEGRNRMIMTDYQPQKQSGVFMRTSLREIRAIHK